MKLKMIKAVFVTIAVALLVSGCSEASQQNATKVTGAGVFNHSIALYNQGDKQQVWQMISHIRYVLSLAPFARTTTIYGGPIEQYAEAAARLGMFLTNHKEFDMAGTCFLSIVNSHTGNNINPMLKFHASMGIGLFYENGLTSDCVNGQEYALRQALKFYMFAQQFSTDANMYVDRVKNRLNPQKYDDSEFKEWERNIDQGLKGILGDELYGEVFGRK